MKSTLFPSNNRGHADFGWLKARYSFSFSSYFNEQNLHFGALRVLNDDIVAPASGFGTHPHNNMEIITIPLRGKLRHKDSTGHEGEIQSGEVQVMSAGSGITHSEFNASQNEELNLLQIWIFPEKQNVQPAYNQHKYDPQDLQNKWFTVVGPNGSDNKLTINQNAFLRLAKFEANQEFSLKPTSNEFGQYLFVIDGELQTPEFSLKKRDALGIVNSEEFTFKTLQDAFLLCIEVPMIEHP